MKLSKERKELWLFGLDLEWTWKQVNDLLAYLLFHDFFSCYISILILLLQYLHFSEKFVLPPGEWLLFKFIHIFLFVASITYLSESFFCSFHHMYYSLNIRFLFLFFIKVLLIFFAHRIWKKRLLYLTLL